MAPTWRMSGCQKEAGEEECGTLWHFLLSRFACYTYHHGAPWNSNGDWDREFRMSLSDVERAFRLEWLGHRGDQGR